MFKLNVVFLKEIKKAVKIQYLKNENFKTVVYDEKYMRMKKTSYEYIKLNSYSADLKNIVSTTTKLKR